MKTFILVTELNAHKKANPNARYFAKCAWGDWEVNLYSEYDGWLRRTGELCGMGLCVCPSEKVEVR